MFYGNRKCLVKGIYSNTRRQGEILEHVRSMLGAEISAVTLNRNVQCGVHRDRRNCTKSFIAFLGDFEGGALVLETGVRFEGRREWFSFDGAKVSHWNEPITAGRKFSVVAYTQRGAFKSE